MQTNTVVIGIVVLLIINAGFILAGLVYNRNRKTACAKARIVASTRWYVKDIQKDGEGSTLTIQSDGKARAKAKLYFGPFHPSAPLIGMLKNLTLIEFVFHETAMPHERAIELSAYLEIKKIGSIT